MLYKNVTPKRFLPTLFVAVWFAIFSLAGCGGGGGDDGGSSGPSYSERDVSFGGIVLNHFTDRSITLTNAGSVNLPLGDIEDISAPFSIESDTCSGITLGPSGTCDIQIRFTPTAQLDYEDFFVVPLSGSDTNFVGVNLDGYGWGYNVSINQLETDCPDIRLLVSVTDSDDSPVTGLGVDDFLLSEDDAPIQSGDSTVTSGSLPNLSVVLAIDTSESIADANALDDIKDAAKAFIDDMDNANEVAIFDIADTEGVQLLPFTEATDPTGKNSLKATIDSITEATGTTALYQAVMDISDYIDSNAVVDNRRAIVLVTDGQDTSSPEGSGIEEAIAAAQQANVPLFAIGLGVENSEVIDQLSDDTGGQPFHTPDAGELDTAYCQVSELISNQYEIVYSSTPNDGATVYLVVGVDDDVGTGEATRTFSGCP